MQANSYNASELATVLVAIITSNTALASMPGNCFIPATASGLPRDSVVNVTAIVTLDKSDLTERVGEVPAYVVDDTARGLRQVFAL